MIDASEIFEFGEWLPDLGDFDNAGALRVENCISEGNRYRPFKQFQQFSDALGDECKGAFAYRDAAGNVTIFAATKTAIYKLNNTSWDDVSRTTGGAYATSDDGFWQFVNYGDLIIATNYNDDIQVFDISTDANFSQLSSSAPRCRTMFVLRNFLVCLDVADGDGATAYRVRWSPFANPEGDWTDVTIQADFQDIIGAGFVNTFGVEIQDVGYIVQDRFIFRMEFVGGDTIFRLERVEDARGSIFNRGVIAYGRNIYYPSEDGFYEFDGVASRPIGDGKVDQYFAKLFDPEFDYRLNAAVDPINKVVMWAFASTDAVGGEPDLIITFNWADRRWTLVRQVTQVLFRYLSAGFTLEQLDNIESSIEDLPFSLDSRNWTGGKTIFGAFDATNKLGSFDGVPMTALFGTKEIRPNVSGRATVQSIVPYVEGGSTIRGRLGCREKLNQDAVWTIFTGLNGFTGELDFTKDLRFARAEIEASGDWDRAIGISIRAQASGNA